MRTARFPLFVKIGLPGALALFVPGAIGVALNAQPSSDASTDAGTETARAALNRALQEEKRVRAKAESLQRQAAGARQAADATARQAAAMAARIQQSEAAIATGEARLALIARKRAVLKARLAQRQEPIVHLTAALQTISRRPLVLSLFQPGSLRDLVYTRAVLSSALPQVEQRTAALRADLDRSRALEREALQAIDALRADENQWGARRKQLATLETQQRLTSRKAGALAARETDRALALAEKSTDLDALVGVLDKAADRRRLLAELPGPILRPPRPEKSQVVPADKGGNTSQSDRSGTTAMAGPRGYILPVTGRIVSGFGATLPSGLRSEGIRLAPRAMAQVVAPASGRIAFAGPYRGYGRIVIIEHEGGWTSLVTGLLRVDAKVGDSVVAGAPLGVAGSGNPVISLELRQDGKTFNPLEFLDGGR
ncbi:MAG: murein hydrolase activator EnvC [Novosphingobium sp.]